MFPTDLSVVVTIILNGDFLGRPNGGTLEHFQADHRTRKDVTEPFCDRIEPSVYQNQYCRQKGDCRVNAKEISFGDPHLSITELKFDLEEERNGNGTREQHAGTNSHVQEETLRRTRSNISQGLGEHVVPVPGTPVASSYPTGGFAGTSLHDK